MEKVGIREGKSVSELGLWFYRVLGLDFLGGFEWSECTETGLRDWWEVGLVHKEDGDD